jgi:hypothetical protein
MRAPSRIAARTGTVAAGVAATVGIGALMITPARADDSSSGVAIGTATASGVRTSYDLPGFLVLDTYADAGGPIAQSVVNSTSNGTAFASFPYPGDTVVNAPALVNVATGQPFPVTYPFYVLADGLTPKASAKDATGSLALGADAGARTANSEARLAGPTAGVISTAGSLQGTSVVISDDGVMTSIADSLTRGIDVQGVLKIAEVHVRTTSILKPGDRKPTTTSATEVTGVSVLGQPVGLNENGIAAPGGAAGSPYAPVLDDLNQALAKEGISVALAGGRSVEGGMSNAGVEILQRGALPLSGSPVGVARTLVGNASSFIVGGSGSLLSLAESSGESTAASTGTVPAGVSSGASVPASVDAAGLPVTVPGANDAVPAGVPTIDFVPQAGPSTANASVAMDLDHQFTFLYLAIALGAGAAVLMSVLWRSGAVLKGGRA